MPQVMCPNCGMTINLENRREVDANLIVNAVKRRPRTFTELLHITRLPRKTLSFRLKELCLVGIIIKKDGAYEAKDGSTPVVEAKKSIDKFSNAFSDRRIRTTLMLVALLLSFSASGYALAMLLAPPRSPEKPPEPVLIGEFSVALDVNFVEDLYAWQVVIAFNSCELRVIDTIPGEFLGVKDPFFLNATDVGDGILLLAGTLYGDVAGKDGSGRLATIIFGYYIENYKEPEIALQKAYLTTYLLDSEGSFIPIINPTSLTLTSIVTR